MRSEHTPAVIRALENAQEWAGRLGETETLPAHLLLGLLDEEEGRPALLLARAGVERARVHELLAPVLTAQPSGVPNIPVPQGERVEEILRSAAIFSHEVFAERTVTSERVLLTLLRGEKDLRRSLEQLGLCFNRLEAEILAGQSPPLALDEPLELQDPTEDFDTNRILDANANRAREALRVVEDYCRFVLEDGFLCGELKSLRHSLTAILSELIPGNLLESRDTQGDVGTTLTTAREQQRYALADVVKANLKRLQEALRCLEEYGKLREPMLGEVLKGQRYRAYILECALLLGATARQRLADARLYVLLTPSRCTLGLEQTIQKAAEGGAQVFQLREKGLPDRELLERARLVRSLTREAGALFIMNDRPDLARLAEADGVHLGQDELSASEARRILGPNSLIGVSTHDVLQVRDAVLDGASYIGVGPTFPSETKEFTDFPGLEFVRRATAETSLPAFAIGGITLKNFEAVLAAGARRVAVGAAICQSETPGAVAAAMRRLLG
jgi:thiamine-phosphate pyrophosphorylase